MRHNYGKLHDWIGLSEGGFVDHPRDPGGATNFGVTQATFNSWRRSHGKPVESVRNLTKAEAEDIIERNYFNRSGADELPSGLDYTVADYAVNSGVSRSVKVLQRELNGMFGAGLKVDGIFGDHTLDSVVALSHAEQEKLIIAINRERMGFLRGLKHWDAFGTGWSKRVMGRSSGVQTDDVGVIDRSVMLVKQMVDIPAPVVAAPGKAPDEADDTPAWVAYLIDAIASLLGTRYGTST